MANKKHNTEISELREKAEEQVRQTQQNLEYMSPEEIRHLVQELSVQQIELQMRNEELRRAQLELEQSHNDYAELFDDAPVGYLLFDVDGVIKKINLTGAKLLNLEKDRIENKPFTVFLAEGGPATFFSHLQKAAQTRKQQTCVLEFKKALQPTAWAKLYTIAVIDIVGQVTGYKTAILDITDISRLSGK